MGDQVFSFIDSLEINWHITETEMQEGSPHMYYERKEKYNYQLRTLYTGHLEINGLGQMGDGGKPQLQAPVREFRIGAMPPAFSLALL